MSNSGENVTVSNSELQEVIVMPNSQIESSVLVSSIVSSLTLGIKKLVSMRLFRAKKERGRYKSFFGTVLVG